MDGEVLWCIRRVRDFTHHGGMADRHDKDEVTDVTAPEWCVKSRTLRLLFPALP